MLLVPLLSIIYPIDNLYNGTVVIVIFPAGKSEKDDGTWNSGTEVKKREDNNLFEINKKEVGTWNSGTEEKNDFQENTRGGSSKNGRKT